MVVCGDESSGKSTIVQTIKGNKYADDSSNSKSPGNYSAGLNLSTVSRQIGQTKEILNIYEVAGGRAFESLIDVLVTEKTYKNCGFLVVFDSTLGLKSLMSSLDFWSQVIEKYSRKYSHLVEENNSKDESGGDPEEDGNNPKTKRDLLSSHPDRSSIKNHRIPVVYAASKYDQFERFEMY